jgi:hypothetical protein
MHTGLDDVKTISSQLFKASSKYSGLAMEMVIHFGNVF